MKKLTPAILLILAALLTACSQIQSSGSKDLDGDPADQTGSATIASIEILPATSGENQQRILVRGTLPSGCAVLGNAKIKQSGRAFDLSLEYSDRRDVSCSADPIDFDKVVSLDLAPLAAGEYTIHAGGETATFSVADSLAAAQPDQSALPIPQPTPVESNPTQPMPVETASPQVQSTAAQPTPAETASNPAETCTNKMAFFADITVPDGTDFKQGETFTKTWRLRNEGTCAITSSYTLVFASGDPLNGPLTSPMPDINPGQVADLSINLTAPDQGGTYAANYEFRDPKGSRFGVNSNGVDTIWVEIRVSWTGSQAVTANATTPSVPMTGACTYSENQSYVDQILSLVNAARANEGVPALSPNSALMAAAMVHSIDMGCNNFLDHTGSDGSKARDRIIAQGYNPSYAAENIYAGATQYGADAQGAFDWWMNSPVHRNNLLNSRPTEAGIGFVSVMNSDYGGYFTMVFAKP